ncbi:MAG: hypothetical protein CFE23_16405 [Flavobacterium sp. BFFFF1]|nr:MAG: hypothetical protein CFE23_16405 [Flavobacterium sp. BFFFF1]
MTQNNLIRSWKINQLVGPEGGDKFFLNQSQSIWGNFIEFKSNGTFVSWYSADCGNDCFTTNLGKYQIINVHYIRLIITKSSQDGECEKFEKSFNRDLGLYQISNVAHGIDLIKFDE